MSLNEKKTYSGEKKSVVLKLIDSQMLKNETAKELSQRQSCSEPDCGDMDLTGMLIW